MSEELKPCPFCGAAELTLKQNLQLDGMCFVICEPCGAVTSFHGRELKKKTISAWNTRPDDHKGEVK